ncbi:MAG: HlyD family secretion protein [Verrucomicrobiales bacterium]
MSEFHPNKTRRRRPRVTWRRLLAFWPLLVWIGIVAIALGAYLQGVAFKRVNGIVDVIQEAVTADADGRIKKILVNTGQHVKEGEPIVEMDTSVLDQQISRIEIAVRTDLADRAQGYQNDLNRLRGEFRDLERDQAGDQGELATLQQSINEIDAAIKANIPGTVGLLRQARGRLAGDHARLTATTKIYPRQIEAVTKEIERMEKEIIALTDISDPEKAARANGDLARLQELKVLRDRATIRTNHTGIVDDIDKDDGEYVARGVPIVRVVAFPKLIRAFLPEDQLNEISLNKTVWVSPQNDRTKAFPVAVKGISPRINNVPDTASPLPNQVVHGQEVVIGYPEKSGLIPGQRVVVHLDEPGKVELFAKLFNWGT